jgi:hypothetical protein
MPTQVIAEFFKRKGFDGVVHRRASDLLSMDQSLDNQRSTIVADYRKPPISTAC